MPTTSLLVSNHNFNSDNKNKIHQQTINHNHHHQCFDGQKATLAALLVPYNHHHENQRGQDDDDDNSGQYSDDFQIHIVNFSVSIILFRYLIVYVQPICR